MGGRPRKENGSIEERAYGPGSAARMRGGAKERASCGLIRRHNAPKASTVGALTTLCRLHCLFTAQTPFLALLVRLKSDGRTKILFLELCCHPGHALPQGEELPSSVPCTHAHGHTQEEQQHVHMQPLFPCAFAALPRPPRIFLSHPKPFPHPPQQAPATQVASTHPPHPKGPDP